MENPQWLFFDIGSTIVDETIPLNRRIDDMVRGTSISKEAFWEKIKEESALGRNGVNEASRFFGIPKAPWHKEEEVPFPHAKPVLSELQKRGYHLGIIANQTPGAKERLDSFGLLSFFSVFIASAEAGVEKPDPAIFRLALSQAGCAPENSVMIGDRLDNDILPASALGMKTVWIRQGFAPLIPREIGEKAATYTVDSLPELLVLFP